MKFKTVKGFILFILGDKWGFADEYKYIGFKFEKFCFNIYVSNYKEEMDLEDIFNTIYGGFIDDTYYFELQSGNNWRIEFEISDEKINRDVVYRIENPTYKGSETEEIKFIEL